MYSFDKIYKPRVLQKRKIDLDLGLIPEKVDRFKTFIKKKFNSQYLVVSTRSCEAFNLFLFV